MKRTHLYLPEPIIDRLRAMASNLDVSVAELIRRAIVDYLAKIDKRA